MALRIDKTLDVFGESISIDCYVVIGRMEGDKSNLQIDVDYKRFDNREVSVNIMRYMFTPNVSDDSLNFYKQGYEFLKKLPEFECSIDV